MSSPKSQPGQSDAPPVRGRAGARVWLRLVPYAVTAVALYFVLHAIDWGSLWAALKLVSPAWFLVALAGFALNLLIQTYRWSLCLEERRKISFVRLLRLFVTSFVFNNLGLGFLGGDVYKTISIAQEHGLRRSATSVLLARITNMWGAAVLPAAFATLAWGLFTRHDVFLWVLVISLMSWPLTVIFFMLPYYRDALSRFLARRRAAKTARALQSDVFAPRNLRLLFASAIAFQVVAVFVHLFLARALSIRIGLGELFVIAPATMLLTSLPISVNGIGVREACYVIGFGVCGVTEPEALAFSALTYSGHVAYCVVGGAILVAERLDWLPLRATGELPKTSDPRLGPAEHGSTTTGDGRCGRSSHSEC